jgi:hypothetical protein
MRSPRGLVESMRSPWGPVGDCKIQLMCLRKKHRGRKSRGSSKHSSNAISHWLQDLIWNLPQATAHFPGRLSLCIVMPVMIA